MNRAQQLKKNPKQREVRIVELNLERKKQRNQLLGELRKISPQCKPTQKSPPKKKSRLELLKEWKLIKQGKENKDKHVKKPPFYAGKVQRKATGSPKLPLTKVAISHSQNRVTTRAQSKRIINQNKPIILNRLNKAENNTLNPVENHSFVLPKGVAALNKYVLTIPMSPKITKSARKSFMPLLAEIGGDFPKPKKTNLNSVFQTQSSSKRNSENILKRVSELTCLKHALFSENIKDVTIQQNIEKNTEIKMDYSPENLLREPTNFEHLVFSPLIEKRRGSSRRFSSATKKLYFVDDDIKQEEINKKSRIQSFRLFLSNETNRLLGLSKHWNEICKDNPSIPSDVEGDINAVVGKTKLLTSDKFKQFESLIEKCEGGDPLIKVDDLQGFHDWVSLEIEDLDKTYFALKQGEEKKWISSAKKVIAPAKKACKVMKPFKKKPTGPSNLRAHIIAARMQMKNKTTPVDNKAEMETTPGTRSPSTSRHATCLSTPKQSNLRVRVLQRCSGIEIMNATSKVRLSQSPIKPCSSKLELDHYIETNTPAKSILRKTPAPKSEKRNVVFGLDPIYLQPAQESPMDDSPSVLQLIETTTPLRRSRRLISKSPGINKH